MDRRWNENKTEKKKKSAVPSSFTLAQSTATVKSWMICRKRDCGSVGNADDYDVGSDERLVRALRGADVFVTTLSIFSLHVGLYGALAILLTPHCLHSLDEEEAPCCRSGIGHCVALCYGTGPVFCSNVYEGCISLQDLDVG